MKYLIFDTETTGLPKNFDAPITDVENWPRCVQLAWQLHESNGSLISRGDFLITPDGFNIPYDVERVHGISTALAQRDGKPLDNVLDAFEDAVAQANFLVGHNLKFDLNIMGAEFVRANRTNVLESKPVLDTCTEKTAELLKLPGGRSKYKFPTLSELYNYLFADSFAEAHNATADVEATARCFFQLVFIDLFTPDALQISETELQDFKALNAEGIKLLGLKHVNFKTESKKLKGSDKQVVDHTTTEVSEEFIAAEFAHLHNHSQFSILQSTSSVSALVKAAIQLKMPAIALTDYSNLMGSFRLIQEVENHNKGVKARNQQAEELGAVATERPLKAIVGCEFYVCDNHLNKSVKDNGYQMVFLAKNKRGYHNLAKLSSIAHADGYYYVPRIDRELLNRYGQDLIVLSGGMTGEIAAKLRSVGQRQAEEAVLAWKQLYADDFYLEICRHGHPAEDEVNEQIIQFAKQHEIKIVATNNTFYVSKEDAAAQDILLCVRDGEKKSTPIGNERGSRYGLENQEYYLKSADEMKTLFRDVPEAILNIQDVLDKVESYQLAREVLLPKFDIPESFQVAEDVADGGKRGENAYLRHLTYEGANERYTEITDEVRERIDFELQTIANSGYPGYFLIVQDFIAEARKMGVAVGPGRGSAAGSVVAYCLKITNIDPLKYNLLFERFLNPERVSMPDIDIDFDDEGRGKVIEYVINKYGKKQVAQIVTYGTMAAKSAIRDTARVLDLPLFEADRLAKMIPSNLNLEKIFNGDEGKLKADLRAEDFEKVKALRQISGNNDPVAGTLNQARKLEGTLRNTGIHACGVIITPDDITNFVPIITAKEEDMYVTQFDNSVVESAGLLKMDFLGLKTLTLIKDTVKLVKYRTGIDLDPDAFPIDDVKTYELFQRGETVGIFQYESPGMQKHMKNLKPTVFEDLIAMNALYRPGPLAYIPSFINRKNGKEPIVYDIDACEELLKDTYGITVYQEQVMLLSQKLANFTKGQADVLRKAMGKKQIDTLAKMKTDFIDGAVKNGYPQEALEKIWKDWEAFAQYAFNKSHSTCYAWIAYQTAYLKANYPAEYMAAVLSNNMNDIKQVSFFMEECRRMGLRVLGPDVNESFYKFTVNANQAIRFGMGAIKGLGRNAVDTIVAERKDGRYKSVFDLAKRIDLRSANKKAFESLALAGGFDSFEGTHRAQYFTIDKNENSTVIEKALRYGSRHQDNENAAQVSLFGDAAEIQLPEPTLPFCEEWNTLEKLSKEKEVVGIYISGHPLDDYKQVIKSFCKTEAGILDELTPHIGKTLSFGGIIASAEHRTDGKGRGFGMFNLECYETSYNFRIFGEEYLKFRHFLTPGQFVFFKVKIVEGYLRKETNTRGEPRVTFLNFSLLANVISEICSSITFKLNVNQLTDELIDFIVQLVRDNRGDKTIHFEIAEIMEQEPVAVAAATEVFVDDTIESDGLEEAPETPVYVKPEVSEIVENTKVNLGCRRHKIALTNELLDVLERSQINFKLS
ncbi:DNA polymerase III subunit alpha [Flavobacterium aurantiibacter]|uniref:DNA polymerase III subunit alpha n=1 Tax=Flavobacterium aurantiibacter TaxID=2023067 RepID=A0A255ZST9_9FLAO|nr:DNA polymerase III subunit alpha [Flavobacterium aurantiibacter]OYQ43790.1 DNA polymerase III subunit alpha [Flavobacterium aurantiibacter]